MIWKKDWAGVNDQIKNVRTFLNILNRVSGRGFNAIEIHYV